MKRKAVWISCILAALFCGRSADARVIITVVQVGPNVEATASGTLDITDRPLQFTYNGFASISSRTAGLQVGPFTPGAKSLSAPFSGPSTFGSENQRGASTGTGDFFGFSAPNSIIVSPDYVSGTPLSGTATWNNTSLTWGFPGLGAIPGTYTWTWGSGAHADSLTLFVAPEPGTLCLLGTSVIGLAGMVRRKLRLGK